MARVSSALGRDGEANGEILQADGGGNHRLNNRLSGARSSARAFSAVLPLGDMIRTQAVLLRIAEQFFREQLTGIYRWDRVKIAPPELREPIAPNISYRDRRAEMERREGRGRFIEKERIAFGSWEILIYSPQERGPLGEVSLRNFDTAQEMVSGPLDASTWERISEHIRANHGNRRAG